MRKLLFLPIALASLTTISSAQTITQNFGAGANAFSIDFATIGNPNNVADTTGDPNPAGSVGYIYNIAKYEVSREQIDKANSAGSLEITMYDMTIHGGNGVNKPATGISWYEAAKFVNYLNTSTGYHAAYKFSGSTFQLWSSTDAGYNADNLFRNSLAKYVIPNSNEWYKGAYGSPSGTWYNFATGSDSAPTAIASGTAANTAVYYGQSGVQSGPADITSAGGLSAYGTMGQGGNVSEWTETEYDVGNNWEGYPGNNWAGERREVRGGAYQTLTSGLIPSERDFYSGMPTTEKNYIGFRVAMIPEPSSLSLLVLGGAVVALCRRKRA